MGLILKILTCNVVVNRFAMPINEHRTDVNAHLIPIRPRSCVKVAVRKTRAMTSRKGHSGAPSWSRVEFFQEFSEKNLTRRGLPLRNLCAPRRWRLDVHANANV